MNRPDYIFDNMAANRSLHNNDSTGFRSSCLSKQCQKSSDETLHVTGKRKVGLFGCDGL